MKKNGKTGYSIKGRYGISANLVDRLVGANAKDYMSIMEKINSRNYFPKSMQEEIENIFKGTVKIVSSNMLVKRWFYRIRIDKKLVYYR